MVSKRARGSGCAEPLGLSVRLSGWFGFVVSFAIALSAAAALCFLRHFATALAVLHALAVFAAVLLSGAAIGFRCLVVRFARALRTAAAVSAARAFSILTA